MTNQFAAYNLSQPILDALTLLGYTTPTPIQEAVIPAALNGRDGQDTGLCRPDL